MKQQMKDIIKMRIISRRWIGRIVPVSDSVAKFARRRGVSSSKITTVDNGIEMTRLEKVDKDRRVRLRRRYNISESQRVFLLFGWDPKIKGVDFLAKAAMVLGNYGRTEFLCLVVSGEGNKISISQMIGKNPYIRVIPPVENVAELYSLADCFVSASRSEAFSYAIGEAMASELPAISSNLSHLVTIYGQAGEGFVTFQNGNVQGLATVLAQVLELSLEKLHRLGESSRRFIEENLAVDKWCEEIVGLYRCLLGLEGSN